MKGRGGRLADVIWLDGAQSLQAEASTGYRRQGLLSV